MAMAPTATVFHALGDDTRRRLLELLVEREYTAGELAGRFAISRPSVSRHLRVLRDAELVTWRGEAQRRVYSVEPHALDAAGAWLDRMRADWSRHLDALDQHLAATKTDAGPPTERTSS